MRHVEADLIEVIAADKLALSLNWVGGMIAATHLLWADDVEETDSLSPEAVAVKEALARYEARKPPQWPDLPFDFSPLSDFHRAALDELAKIPSGKTRTYGEMASILGQPGGAQAVGRAMGANPFPLICPCHRVVGSGGSMTGFSASGGVKMKEYLLRHEGAIQGLLPGLE